MAAQCYYIRKLPEEGDTEPEYWNNDFGWVDESEATSFSEEEMRVYSLLPMQGEWVLGELKYHVSLTASELNSIKTALEDYLTYAKVETDSSVDAVVMQQVSALSNRLKSMR